MLQFFRSIVGSFVVKILFVLLIGSFGLWGVGDFLRQSETSDTSVISVGDTKIQAATVQHDVQTRVSQLRASAGASFTMEQAKALGIVDQIVDGIVTRSLIDNEVAAEHLAISNAQILAAIQNEPAFRNKDGKFDPTTLRNVLAANGLSEQQFEASIREDIGRNLVVNPIRASAAPPAQLADILYQIRNERRVADWVFISAKSLKDPPTPDSATLLDFYNKHRDKYTAPEYRTISVLPIKLADILETIHPSDQDLKDAYQQRQDEFNTVEQRHILQMLLPDEVTAKQAVDEVSHGKDFLDAAKRIAKQDASTVDLDWVKQTDLPGDTGSFAFSAKEGDLSPPIKGDFGWSIIKVLGIKPAHLKTFDEVKPELEASIKNDQASDALYKESNKVEDAIAAGTDFDGLVQQFNLKPVKITAIDATGKLPDATLLDSPPVPLETLTKTAFATSQGQMSGVLESGAGNSFFLLKVEQITASTLKPFDSVKTQVQNDWLTERRADLVADAIKKFMTDMTKVASFVDVAKALKLTIATSKSFTRTMTQTESGLPGELTAKLFHLDVGQSASAITPDGAFIAQLKTINAPDTAGTTASLDSIKQELGQNITNEYLTQYANSLKRRFPVVIKKAAIDELFSSAAP